MYLKDNKKNMQRATLNKKYQSGISLVFLLFIIVVISLLSAALVNMNSHSNISNAHQVNATRAFFAAESGANFQAMKIFSFPFPSVNQCSNTTTTYNFTIAGLNACVAVTQCNLTVLNGNNYYQIISEGQCNSGQIFQATRTVEVRLQTPS